MTASPGAGQYRPSSLVNAESVRVFHGVQRLTSVVPGSMAQAASRRAGLTPLASAWPSSRRRHSNMPLEESSCNVKAMLAPEGRLQILDGVDFALGCRPRPWRLNGASRGAQKYIAAFDRRFGSNPIAVRFLAATALEPAQASRSREHTDARGVGVDFFQQFNAYAPHLPSPTYGVPGAPGRQLDAQWQAWLAAEAGPLSRTAASAYRATVPAASQGSEWRLAARWRWRPPLILA